MGLRSFLKPPDWIQSLPPLTTIWADSSSRPASTKTRTRNFKPQFVCSRIMLVRSISSRSRQNRKTKWSGQPSSCEKVVALQPDNADAQYLLGQNLEHSGDSLAAIQHWKAAVQADPNHSQALYNLAKSLNKIHDPEAKQYQDRFDALQKSQQIADRVSELGNFALEAANAQNWPQAVEQMNEAIQLCGNCPQSAHLHKNLGLFYGRTGNIGEAKKELRTALELAPNDADAQNALAMLERAHEEQVK